jgi:hypothetical protein
MKRILPSILIYENLGHTLCTTGKKLLCSSGGSDSDRSDGSGFGGYGSCSDGSDPAINIILMLPLLLRQEQEPHSVPVPAPPK